jgi:multimeric flavodoxin WrbA
MRIFCINSSLRGNQGLSHLLLTRMVAGARAEGATCEVTNLSQLKMHRCLACDECQSAEPPAGCVYRDKDDVDATFHKIIDADLVVYATPVYVMGLSSLLKSLFERFYAYAKTGEYRLSKSGLFFHDIPAGLCSKPFVSLICCDNFENRMTQNCEDYFRAFSLFHDAEWRGSLVRRSGALLTSSTVVTPEKKQRILDAFELAGRDLARLGRVRRATQAAANREVIPIPGFRYLKRLGGVKRAVLQRARKAREPTAAQRSS